MRRMTLASRGFDVCIIHLLSPDELRPDARGRFRMTDAETGQRIELLVDGAAEAAYARMLRDFGEEWRAFALQHGMRYMNVSSGVPFEELILRYMREGGVLV